MWIKACPTADLTGWGEDDADGATSATTESSHDGEVEEVEMEEPPEKKARVVSAPSTEVNTEGLKQQAVTAEDGCASTSRGGVQAGECV